MKKPELNEAIDLLKTIVKLSNIKGQKHLDFSLVNSKDLERYQIALMVTRESVIKEIITEKDLKIKLGL